MGPRQIHSPCESLPGERCDNSGRRTAAALRRERLWRSGSARLKQQIGPSPPTSRQTYGDASILKHNRVVFNIAGNKSRLVVRINYAYRVVYVRFIGTHAEYDDIDAETI
jgi:mRNA-degrading endonuclease HigB of HigAB toxin-antitoxin module